jgi:hypothetical protein
MASSLVIPIPTAVPVIMNKVTAFYEKMNDIAKFLHDNGASAELQMFCDKVPLEFYIDRNAIARLNHITTLTGFDSLVVMFGLEDTGDSSKPATVDFGLVTACFLGVDSDRNILPQHKGPYRLANGTMTNSALPGEDTWPPPPPPNPPVAAPAGAGPAISNYFMLDSNESDVEDYFS